MVNKLFLKIIEQGLTPNQFYVLLSLYKKQAILLLNLHTEIRALQADGWLTDKVLTEKSIRFVKSLEEITVLPKPNVVVLKPSPPLADRVVEYLNLFPKIKLPSGKYARSDIRVVTDSFAWFFQNYDYTWEEVITATGRYVDEYRRNNWKFMRTAQFFVRKQIEGTRTFQSELANYCMMIREGVEEEKDPFNTKVT